MKVPFSIALIKAYHAHNNLMRPKITEIGLSVGQPKILDFLSRHDGCMQKDLAALCDIEPATISRLLDRMEQDGLLTRSVVEENKRAVSVALTPTGRKRQKEMVAIRNQVETHELEGFNEAEREQFYEYLSRLYKNLTREIGEEENK